MNIGTAIAIFLVLAIVLLVLFCIVTKYFHYKLQKTLDSPEEIYSMVDEINAMKEMAEDVDDEEYDKFK